MNTVEQDQAESIVVRPAFRLGTLMLFVALIAVCLGVLRQTVPFGALISILFAASAGRTVLVAWRSRRQGSTLPVSRLSAVFGASVLITLIVLLCGWLVLLAVSLAIGAVVVSTSRTSVYGPLFVAVPLGLLLVAVILWGLSVLIRELASVGTQSSTNRTR